MIATHHPVIHLLSRNTARKIGKCLVRRKPWLINAQHVLAIMISVSASIEEVTKNTYTTKTLGTNLQKTWDSITEETITMAQEMIHDIRKEIDTTIAE